MDYKCIQCCVDTNMILSNADIERIKELGFDTKFFVSENRGCLQLKNNNGRCVFHDSISCSIYEHRPEGCKLYPIIYDKDKNCAVFDENCPHRHRFKRSNNTKQQLYNLISKLEAEKAQRKRA